MSEEIQTVFIVDDDPMQVEMFSDYLKSKTKFTYHTFDTGETAILKLNELKPQIVFLDYELSKVDAKAKNGLDVLKEIKKISPDTTVVMISGQEKIEIAVNVMRYGAFDYIVKSESAFARAENAIFNILRTIKLQRSERLYRTLSIAFGFGMVIMIFIVIILKILGYINPNPTFEIN